MESFKKALKQGILEKAEAVRFEESFSPQLLHYASEKSLSAISGHKRLELVQLIESLIPVSGPQVSPIREGILSIVSFGEVKLLAVTSVPVMLFAFIPPYGNQLYQQVRNQLYSGPDRVTPDSINIADPTHSNLAAIQTSNHFAMSQATGPDTREALPISNRPNMETAQGPHTHVPPLPKMASPRADSTQLKQVSPQENERHDPQDTLISQSPSLNRARGPAHHHSVQEQTSQFSRMEPTDSQDYHFDQSSYSSSRNGREFTNTHAVAPSQRSAISHSSLSLVSDEQEQDRNRSSSSIAFGAHVPGETIERKGRLPIDSLLEEMVERKASDLHLTLNERRCLRIDGEIVRVGESVITEGEMQSYLLPIMPPKNKKEFAEHSDTDFAYEIPGVGRFRVNVFRDRMGVGSVLRLIPDKVLSADDLGLPPSIRKFCELHKGLVVVTGPTGSGKSTTLAAMIDLINQSRSDHILTIEDPIEFVHQQKKCLVHQREVHKHTQSFSRALRAALREDPDIVLIGEMRDLETVSIAIETAETGHLVFGTLHTNTAISTVDRLIDQFAADQQEQIRVMLAESLKGVVAQTLVKKKGGGRVAAQEILVVDKAVSSLIREGNTHMVQNHMITQKAKGNCTLNDALFQLVSKGLIEAKDAYAKAIDKESFAQMLQQKGILLEIASKSA